MSTVIDRVSFALREGHPVNVHDTTELLRQHNALLSSARNAVLVLDEVAVSTSQCAAIRSMKEAIRTCDGEQQ